MSSARRWMVQADQEMKGAHVAYSGGNLGKARVCCRRAAGMAIKGWLGVLTEKGVAPPEYGTSFMHHLNALADDPTVQEAAVREAAWRLAARGRPPEGFAAPIPEAISPMYDADLILRWVEGRIGAIG